MAIRDTRLTYQSLLVLKVFLDRPQEGLTGADIWKQTKLLSGTLYPILMRLERTGLLESRWEQLDPSESGPPKKRLYRLTGVGYNETRAALGDLGVPMGSPEWNLKGILAWNC